MWFKRCLNFPLYRNIVQVNDGFRTSLNRWFKKKVFPWYGSILPLWSELFYKKKSFIIIRSHYYSMLEPRAKTKTFKILKRSHNEDLHLLQRPGFLRLFSTIAFKSISIIWILLEHHIIKFYYLNALIISYWSIVNEIVKYKKWFFLPAKLAF